LWRLLQSRPLLLLFPDLLVSAAAQHAEHPLDARVFRRPLLAPWWRSVEDRDRLLFEHAGRVVELNGRAVRALLPTLIPLLDGTHAVQEIVEILGVAAEAPLAQALALLDDHGLLVEGPGRESAGACYVAAVCASTPDAVSSALTSSRVAILGSAPAAAELSRLLESAGGVETTSAPIDGPEKELDADLIVAAPAAEEAQHLSGLNEGRLRDATPWLVLLPTDGRFAAVGPLYVPGQTACHACYLLRRGATSGYEQDFALLERRPVQAAMPGAASAIAAGLAALISLRWLGARDPTLPGVLHALELEGPFAVTRHRVLRVPRCPACGVLSPPASPWFRELDA